MLLLLLLLMLMLFLAAAVVAVVCACFQNHLIHDSGIGITDDQTTAL
jgi:hypothetical protein